MPATMKASFTASKAFAAEVKAFQATGNQDGRSANGLFLRGVRKFKEAGLDGNSANRMTIAIMHKLGQKIG